MMNIGLKDQYKNQYYVDALPNWSINDLKREFCNKYSQNFDTVRIILKSSVLKGDEMIHNIDISDGLLVYVPKAIKGKEETQKKPIQPIIPIKNPEPQQIVPIKPPEPQQVVPIQQPESQSLLSEEQKIVSLNQSITSLLEMGYDEDLVSKVVDIIKPLCGHDSFIICAVEILEKPELLNNPLTVSIFKQIATNYLKAEQQQKQIDTLKRCCEEMSSSIEAFNSYIKGSKELVSEGYNIKEIEQIYNLTDKNMEETMKIIRSKKPFY